MLTNSEILQNITELAAKFGHQRLERQKRRSLDAADFEQIYQTGYLLTCVPTHLGGMWQGVQASIRPICEMLRQLAHGDSSVALVSAMHPSVLANWLCPSPVPTDLQAEWDAQCERIFEGVKNGEQWGTITSEPGSGGDIDKTISGAFQDDDGQYFISGKKHFGSGSGVLTNMVTTAIPSGESAPDMFFVRYKDEPWDGSTGVRLIAEWEAHGMPATQSHSMEFSRFPAERIVWAGPYDPAKLSHAIGPCTFIAVIVGVVEIAYHTAKQLLSKKQTLAAYEKVEFAKIEHDFWLLQKGYEGILSDIENGNSQTILWAKIALANLCESILTQICRVMGGSTLSRHSPFGYWAQDVKALGFLRPPWVLAHETMGYKINQ